MFARNLSKRVCSAFVLTVGVAVLCVIASGTAQAQTNKRTSVTFSGPVEIPGVGAHILPAGTYLFRVLDSQSDRHIVQVFSSDESKLHATILAIANYRLRATDKTVITFAERPAGEPQALRAWFYPGDNWGQEFVYPKRRAVELAKMTNQPVLYLPDELAPSLETPVKTAVEPPVVALKTVPLRAVSPRGDDIALTEVVTPPPTLVASLPKTASALPLLALVGLMSLMVGYSLKPSCAL